MHGLSFLQSLLKRPEHLLFCNYVPLKHLRFDKSPEKYGMKGARSRIFSLVPNNGCHSRHDRGALALRAGSNLREIDARVYWTSFDLLARFAVDKNCREIPRCKSEPEDRSQHS